MRHDDTDASGSPDTEAIDPAIADPKARVAKIARLFEEISDFLEDLRASIGPASAAQASGLAKKLGELQTAHTMLLKAEGDFHDKFDEAAGSGIDHDAIRAELGRALDRIRASGNTDDVSARSDPEAG